MSIDQAKSFIEERIQEGYFQEEEFENMDDDALLEFAIREKEIEELIREEVTN